ncbi:MAG: hypothetical protein NWE90_01120 [Candidatus Bathyarchaeota archaeon]|nr:hypothetical protein [Candidatus Bathyarchaeota archaeon]
MTSLAKLMLSSILITVIVLGLTSPVKAQPPYFPNVIVSPTSISAEVSTTFSITFSVEDIPSGYGLTYLGLVLTWPSSDMELVSGTEGASLPPGWKVSLGDWTVIPPGSEKKYFQMSIDTGEPVTVDREWLTVTFHCLRPGPSMITVDGSREVRELPDGSISGQGIETIGITVNQFGVIGGVTTPVNKIEILTPYLALAGLIVAVSTVYVIKRRKA